LNTIVTEAIDEHCTKLEAKLESGTDLEVALKEVLVESLKETHDIVFNGDGYSDDWVTEAEKRGLLNLKTTPDALPHLTADKNLELFEKYKILSHDEVHSRLEIWAEQYVTNVTIEVDTTEAIAKTMVYPAAVRYMNELATAVKETKALGLENSGAADMLKTVTGALNDLGSALNELAMVQKDLKGGDITDQCREYKEKVIPAMTKVRDAVDFLERYTADDYWPLPVYREMLFVK